MRNGAMPALTPTAAQLEEMVRLKNDIADDVRESVHEAWALSWLAMHSFDASRSDYSADKHQEAANVALGYVVSLLEKAKDRHDADFTGVFRAVMDKAGAAP